MSVIGWIIFGLIAGALAKFLMPGRQGGGIIITIILGIVGALVGGFIGNSILGVGGVDGFNMGSFLIAVLGAILVLFIYGRLAARR